MDKLLNNRGNVVEIQGILGSDRANGLAAGFRQHIAAIQITHWQAGDLTHASGEEIMRLFLEEDRDIQGLLAHNDEMALGAIQAIEEAGLKPGVDIKIISVDATRSAFLAMIDGKLNAAVEVNPLLGPMFIEAALHATNGKPLPRWVDGGVSVFYAEDAAKILPDRKY